MKKILSTIAAIAVLATSGLALDTSKMYAGAALGIESISGLDSGIAMILTAGLPVKEKGELGEGTLAVEAETSFDLSSPSIGSEEWSVFTLGGYAAYKYDIDEKLYVKPRVGLIYRSYSYDYDLGWLGTGSVDFSEIGLAFSVQGGYKLDDKLDVTFGYNIIGASISQLTVGALYRF